MPVTFKGWLLTAVLKCLFGILHLFKKKEWNLPVKNFEENPFNMTDMDAVYLGYKYYYRPHQEPEEGFDARTFFKQQQLDFSVNDNFKITQSITLHAGGDLMPYKWLNRESTKYLWDETGDFFFGADLVFANLETPVNTRKPLQAVPEVMLNDMYFNGSEELFHIFSGNGKHKGYDVLSIANNHSLDMGKKGIVRTMEFLREQGVEYCGAALSEANLNKFPIIERKGIRTAFLSYTYSLNKLLTPVDKPWLVNLLPLNSPDADIDLIKQQCKMARKKGADFIVVSVHCGNAYQTYPSKNTTELFQRIFTTCGADIILGGHPHNAQPMQSLEFIDPITGKHKKGFAIYSLADFVTYDIFTWCHMPVMLELKLSRGLKNDLHETRITGIKVLPVYNYYNKQQDKFRFVPLEQAYTSRNSYTNRQKQEIEHLHYFCHHYFLPENSSGLLL